MMTIFQPFKPALCIYLRPTEPITVFVDNNFQVENVCIIQLPFLKKTYLFHFVISVIH